MRSFLGSWIEEAACKGYSHLFYPKDAERPQAKDRREQKAKTLCAVCPVLDSCKEHAQFNGEFGIWGGQNEEERFLAGHAVPRYAGINVNRRVQRQRQKQKENV